MRITSKTVHDINKMEDNFALRYVFTYPGISIFQYSKPLRMRIISWGQQNIHVANPKKKLIIINYLKLR
jgi:hypothetical protein